MNSKNDIFLIDDDQTANFINEMQIKRFSNNFNIQTFVNAKNALSTLKNGVAIPEFIFLDINMPEMDGWEFIQKFQELNLSSKIVLVTSSLDPIDKIKAKSIEGVVSFIEKPMVKKDLVPLFSL